MKIPELDVTEDKFSLDDLEKLTTEKPDAKVFDAVLINIVEEKK
jgi:hypothetical protein